MLRLNLCSNAQCLFDLLMDIKLHLGFDLKCHGYSVKNIFILIQATAGGITTLHPDRDLGTINKFGYRLDSVL